MTRLLIFLLPIVVLFACEAETILDQSQYESKIVIDGWIEQGGFPRVIVGRSSSYFDAIDSSTVSDLVIRTAKVTVSDGTTSEVLTLRKDNNYFPPYVYAGTSIRGESGKTYSLTVEHDNSSYTASTTIPPPAAFDRLWFQLAEGEDSIGYIYGKFTDNPDETNYYRIFTRRENEDNRYIPVYLSAVGDQSFNGKSFTFTLLRGPDNFTNVVDDLYFKLGDTVRVKFCTMDQAHFDFWRTLERELYVVGNPFSSSGNRIISNINGNALGVWGGYGVTNYQVIARK